MKKINLIPLLAVGILSLSTLTGCAVMDGLRNEASADFETTKAVAEGWDKTAPWLPADASGIRTRSATNGASAILRADSTAQLDPALCAEVPRQSGPVYSQDWAPDPYVDTVWACGDWAVIPTDDGWFGWTPNHPSEKEASPAAGK